MQLKQTAYLQWSLNNSSGRTKDTLKTRSALNVHQPVDGSNKGGIAKQWKDIGKQKGTNY